MGTGIQTAGEIDRLSRQGYRLIESAAELVRPGGLLSIITCSIEPEENAEVVARFLAARQDFSPAELGSELPPSAIDGLIGTGRWQVLPGSVHDGFTVHVLVRHL